MHLTLVNYVLWVLGPPLQGLICAAMLKQRLVREYPSFFVYTAFHVVRTGLLFYVYHRMPYASYFWTYWQVQAISAVLGFAVIYEIYQSAFRPYEAIRRLGPLLFGSGVVVLLIVAIVVAVSSTGAAEMHPIIKAVFTLELSVRLIQCGLLLVLFVFSGYSALAWRHYAFGMALGFGIFASVEMANTAIFGQFGSVAGKTFTLVNSAAYDCAVLIWIGYFLVPEPAIQPAAKIPNYDLEAWNRTLLQLLKR